MKKIILFPPPFLLVAVVTRANQVVALRGHEFTSEYSKAEKQDKIIACSKVKKIVTAQEVVAISLGD